MLKVAEPLASYANISFSPNVNFSRPSPFENMIRSVSEFVWKSGSMAVAAVTVWDIESVDVRAPDDLPPCCLCA